MVGEDKIYLIIVYSLLEYIFVIYKKSRGIRTISISIHLEKILYPFMRKDGTTSIFSVTLAIFLLISNIIGYLMILFKVFSIHKINNIWLMSNIAFLFFAAAAELLFSLSEIEGKIKKIIMLIVSLYTILGGGMILLFLLIRILG